MVLPKKTSCVVIFLPMSHRGYRENNDRDVGEEDRTLILKVHGTKASGDLGRRRACFQYRLLAKSQDQNKPENMIHGVMAMASRSAPQEATLCKLN